MAGAQAIWHVTLVAIIMSTILKHYLSLKHISPGQNGHHFADDVFKSIFINEKFRIMMKISLKFVPRRPIDNNTALV